MMKNVVIVSLFVALLLIQHPEFLKDAQNALLSTFTMSAAGSNPFSFLMVLCLIFILYKRFQKFIAQMKLAGGVGMRLHSDPEMGWIVLEVVADGSADAAGLKLGDCITHVDGVAVHDLKSFTAVRGPVGSYVSLRVQRGLSGAAAMAEKILQSEEAANGEQVSVSDDASTPCEVSETVDEEEPAFEERVISLQRKAVKRASADSKPKPESAKKDE